MPRSPLSRPHPDRCNRRCPYPQPHPVEGDGLSGWQVAPRCGAAAEVVVGILVHPLTPASNAQPIRHVGALWIPPNVAFTVARTYSLYIAYI